MAPLQHDTENCSPTQLVTGKLPSSECPSVFGQHFSCAARRGTFSSNPFSRGASPPLPSGQPGHAVSDMTSIRSEATGGGRTPSPEMSLLFSPFFSPSFELYNTHYTWASWSANPTHYTYQVALITLLYAPRGLPHLSLPLHRRAAKYTKHCSVPLKMTRRTGSNVPKCGVSSRNATHPRPVFFF